jgi:signal transduction histidine kinase
MDTMKVLVVDGCKEQRREVVEALLDLTNVIVYGAVGSVKEAMRVITSDPPDLVVTEDELPDGRGADLCAAAQAAGADIYIRGHAAADEVQRRVLDLIRARRSRPDPLRLLGRIAAGVAHDLNNYLAVVSMSLEALQRDHRDPELWMQAKAALETSTRITRNLTTYARGGSPDPAPIDLSALARRTIGVVARLLPAGVLISLDLDDAPPAVYGVAAELEQVILNLVLNACDAMPRGGELRVCVRARGDGIALEVIDTGGGIADAPRFAEGTLSPSSKPGRAGAGLGLGIVRAVAERHRAALLIAPRDQGGTSVTVMFPRAA